MAWYWNYQVWPLPSLACLQIYPGDGIYTAVVILSMGLSSVCEIRELGQKWRRGMRPTDPESQVHLMLCKMLHPQRIGQAGIW